MADIQEIPLDIVEHVQDIVEDIAETKTEEEPVILEEVKPVIKPKAKGRPKGHRSLGPKKLKCRKLRWKLQWKKSPMSPPLQRGISNCPRTLALVMSRLPC